MNIEILNQRVEALQKLIEQGAGEINKLIGRLEEAKSWVQYIKDNEATAQESQEPKQDSNQETQDE